MKGDFSRIRFTPQQHFTSVLEQQGRVSLDADANEQCAIDEHLRTTQVIDTIGAAGGPVGNAGFEITVEDSTILISGGRYYVHGLLCESSATDYMAQPYLINPSVTDVEYLDELEAGTIDAICVELQVWQRLVTALDDPCLLEPALGQADTTARLQTVWRVVASPIQPPPSSVGTAGTGISQRVGGTAELLTKSGAPVFEAPPFSIDTPGSINPIGMQAGKLCVGLSNTGDDCSCQPIPPAGYQGLENQLYRIEIHQTGDETAATFKWSRENASIVAAVTSYSGNNPQTIFVDSLGKDANLGFAANQWVEISDDTTEFGDVPNQPGQLCQISRVSPAGQPPSITFTTTVPAVDPTKNARVRRWDQPGTGTAGDMPLSVTTPIDIENGIQVTFTPGTYKSGDYWLIPARTASGTIDWPPCGSNGATCQPANNIPIYTVPLALITLRNRFTEGGKPVMETPFSPTQAANFGNTKQLVVTRDQARDPAREEAINTAYDQSDYLVEDLRSFFTPLAAKALHINRISWANDDVITLDQLAADGLALLLDNSPTSLIDSSVFRVSVEIPSYGDEQERFGVTEFGNPTGVSSGVPLKITNAARLRTEFAIDGVVRVFNQAVYWQILPDASNKISFFFGELLFRELNTLLQAIPYAPNATWYARVRVRLMGHMIYAQSSASDAGCGPPRTLFLDGQCFATAGTRQDQTPNINLQFPSGSSAMASDFESWFYLAPAPTISGVFFNPSSITLPGGTPTGTTTGTVNLYTPVPVDTIVTLTTTPPTGLTISVPATITVPAGQNSQTFTANFTVTAPTSAAGVVGIVTASISWQAGFGSSNEGSFTVIAPNL